MKKYLRHALLIGTVFLLGCCSDKNNAGENLTVPVITVNAPTEDSLFNVAYDLECIVLETKEQSLLNDIKEIDYADDKFFITDFSDCITIFDSTGKFISRIDRKGRGPQEYLTTTKTFVDQSSKQIVISDNYLKKILVYDWDGNFIKETPTDLNPMYTISDKGSFLNISPGRYTMYKNNSQIYDNQIHVIDSTGKFVKGMLPITVDNAYITVDLPNHNGKTYYKPPMENQIYSISANGVEKEYEIDYTPLNKKYIPANLKAKVKVHKKNDSDLSISDLEKQGYIISLPGLDISDDYIVTTYGWNPRHDVFYNRKTGNSVSIEWYSLQGANMYEKVVFFCNAPLIINDKFGCIVSNGVTRQLLESPYESPLKQIFADYNENDNPRILLYRIRGIN